MNHIIKFRVWDGQRFLRSYAEKGESFEYPAEIGKIVDIGWFIQCQRLESPQKFWVQQFTNLHDKNNREIYEGDILSLIDLNQKTRIGTLTFDCYVGGYCVDLVGGGTIWPAQMRETGDFEVIGNIFETPELLNK